MTNPDEIKDLITKVPTNDKLFILGDFNARVGCDSDSWNGIIRKHGVGKCNSNGLLLLQTCAEYDLLITNTVFLLQTRNKTSWMHPRSKHWHLIDYIICEEERQDVRVTKAMCGAECWTDHHIIISKLNLRIQPLRRPQGKKSMKRLAVNKLKFNTTKQLFTESLDKQLDSISLENQNVESAWATLGEKVYNSALECLGTSTTEHKDWFDKNCDELNQLLEKNHTANKALLNDPSSAAKKQALTALRKTIQQKLRHMQDSWLSKKADEIEEYADKNDMKNFYSGLKEIYGPTTSSSPILNKDGTTLITDKEDILKRWAEHFDSVLNHPSAINDEAINRIPQIPTNEALDTVPTQEELVKAISQLSRAKHLAQIAFQRKYTNVVVQLSSVVSCSCSDSFGNKKQFLKTSRMPQLSICTSVKGTVRTATTIVEYPYCLLQEKYWLEYFLTDL